MKWLKENKLKSLGILFGVITSFFVMLDKGFDFWEEHIAKSQPQRERAEIIKTPINTHILYEKRTTFENKAGETKWHRKQKRFG